MKLYYSFGSSGTFLMCKHRDGFIEVIGYFSHSDVEIKK